MAHTKPNKKAIIALLALAAAGAAGWHFWTNKSDGNIVSEGNIEATSIIIRSETTGILQKINFDEGQQVNANTVLATVEQTNASLVRTQIEEQVASLQAQLTDLKNGTRPEQIAQAAAVLGQAQAQLEKMTSIYINNKKIYERNQELYNAGGTPEQSLDTQKTLYLQSQADMANARQQVASASENLRLLKKGPTQENIRSLEAKVAEAKARLAGQQLALDKTYIRTTNSGTVASRLVEPGELVTPGTAIAKLLDMNDLKITCYVPSTALSKISLDEKVKIKVMGITNKEFTGKITNIAAEAEFTPLNKQSGDDRADLVFAVKVKLLDKDNLLHPGMPADVVFVGAGK